MYLGRPNNSDKPRFDGKFTIDEWHYWNNLLSDKDIHNVYMIKNFVQQKQDCIWKHSERYINYDGTVVNMKLSFIFCFTR